MCLHAPIPIAGLQVTFQYRYCIMCENDCHFKVYIFLSSFFIDKCNITSRTELEQEQLWYIYMHYTLRDYELPFAKRKYCIFLG